jgi:L-lactate dehydrogenase
VIAAGAVGSACALSMLQRGSCREIVLMNQTRERTAGAVTDMGYGRPLSPPVDLTAGDYEDLAGTDLVIITVRATSRAAEPPIATIPEAASGCWTKMRPSTAMSSPGSSSPPQTRSSWW